IKITLDISRYRYRIRAIFRGLDFLRSRAPESDHESGQPIPACITRNFPGNSDRSVRGSRKKILVKEKQPCDHQRTSCCCWQLCFSSFCPRPRWPGLQTVPKSLPGLPSLTAKSSQVPTAPSTLLEISMSSLSAQTTGTLTSLLWRSAEPYRTTSA